MTYEHKLSPAAAGSFKAAFDRLNELRLEYLRALGLAKEAEDKSSALQAAIGQQMAMIQDTEGLPTPVRPYALSADYTRLVGEVPDKPAAAAPPIVPVTEVLVNGAADHA